MAVERKWVIFGVLVLLMIAGFVAGNKYWFYPTYTVRINAPVPYTPPKDIPEVVVIKPFEGTLRKIIQAAAAPDEQLASGVDGDRCPFLWEDELKPKKGAAPPPKEKAVEIPRLSMIIVGNSGSLAMLDKTLVHEGDRYNGHVVENIGPEYIILSGDYGVLKITMPARSFGDPRVDILEETNPELLIRPVVRERKDRKG